MTSSPKFNYYFDVDRNYSGLFTGLIPKTSRGPDVIDRCQTSLGQFLMFSTGIKMPKVVSEVKDFSFTGELRDDGCRIDNSLLSKSFSFEHRKSTLESQFKTLRTCVELEVVELDGNPIRFPENQLGCQINIIAPNHIRMVGDFCFISPNPRSRYSLAVALKKDCRNPEYLVENGLQPRDLEFVLNAYLTGDTTGLQGSVDPIGSSSGRLMISPLASNTELTEDLGDRRPRWNSTWAPDIELGNIEVTPRGQRTSIDLSILIDQRSAEPCVGKLCSSDRDFSVPVSGEVTLSKIKTNGKKEFLDYWIYGAVSPAQYVGLLSAPRHMINFPIYAENTDYELEILMVDPHDDFQMFQSGIAQMLINIKDAWGSPGLDDLKPLQIVDSLLPLGSFSGLGALSGADVTEQLERALAVFQNFDQGKDWPPYYEKVCDGDKCMKAGSRKYSHKLQAKFKLRQVEGQRNLEAYDIRYNRSSGSGSSRSRVLEAFPSIKCGA